MPVDPDRACKCHGEPMYAHGGRHRCNVKRKATALRAQKKYERTPQGQAVHRKYRQTPKGKAVMQRSGRKRIFVGRTYHSRAPTVEQAAAINAHIRRRLNEFVTRQSAGTEAESLPPRAVRPETASRTDRLGGRLPPD